MARLILLSLVLAAAALTVGCSSSETTESSSPEIRFNQAKKLFDDREYLDAINEFTVVTLQYSGSAFASEAQFYIGECRFNRGEYLLAAFEYNQLKRNYPASPRVPEAQYKLALSYYNLSPRPLLDQQYTRKAIDEFQSFVEYYSGNERAVDADAKIRELTTKLAKKAMDTARLYTTMGYYKAAQFYFDDVIERYHDTEFGPLAYIEKTELLITRKKFEDADGTISKFISLYPNNVLRARADDLKAEAVKGLAEKKKSASLHGPEAQGPGLGKSDH
jgi:outer membrane protein assembly factor BamD